MARRRDIRPPFEVMKAAAQSASASAREGSQAISVAPPAESGDSGQATGGMGSRHGGGTSSESWARLRQPLVLRVPPGYAVLIGLGVLILLVVAYSAGYSQGGSSMAAKAETQARNERGMASRMEQGQPGTSAQGQATSGSSSGNMAAGNMNNTVSQADRSPAVSGLTGVYDDSAMDPRKPNYQYYIVAHCSKEEAERMVIFFAERGVEAAAVISHNRRSQYVVFILRPFTREQTASTEARTLKLKIFEWGKVWASREYRGPTNLSDTYMAVYHPKEN